MATSGISASDLKCNRCAVCDGYGCIGMLPGLGGVFENKNFQLNCEGWAALRERAASEGRLAELEAVPVSAEQIRCGPVTGAVENIGYERESDFYYPYLRNALDAGFSLCVGDGFPDEKLRLGADAVQRLRGFSDFDSESRALKSAEKKSRDCKAAFFLKPYPQEKLFERVEWVRQNASHIGIDIDSYNILTMRNLVHLERKTDYMLQEFRRHTALPFVLKGVFTDDDLDLVRQIHPDVVYISNHGGRVETRLGSTADFLADHAKSIRPHCGEIWVDGGIRTKLDVQTALFYGANQVIVARPLIRATFDDCYAAAAEKLLG